MNKSIRNKVCQKYNGKCAYSGTDLEDDWQIDHIVSKNHGGISSLDNLVPCQQIINHYKRGLWLDDFRNIWLGKLHIRLSKLPKKPKVERSIKRKAYMLRVAGYFGITPDKPFCGKFYFETLRKD